MRTSCLSAAQTMGWFQVTIWQRQVCCLFLETRQEVRELRVIVPERIKGEVTGHGFNGGLSEMFWYQLVASIHQFNLILPINNMQCYSKSTN